jgi:hypothetical protein
MAHLWEMESDGLIVCSTEATTLMMYQGRHIALGESVIR